MLYTHNHYINDIDDSSTYTYAKVQVDSNTQATLLFRYEGLLTSDFSSST